MELIIAITISLTVLSVAATLLAGSFNTRLRENQKTDGLADAQRALNLMTREIANSGYGLTNNGIVAGDSSATTIRVRANLNATSGETSSTTTTDRDEDIKYMLYTDAGSSYIVRLDVNTAAQETVLANRVDTLNIRYYANRIDYTPDICDIRTTATEVTQKSLAKFVVITVCVTLPERGTPGSSGYIPASSVQMISDVTLRNADLVNY
ncbi:MAG: hypothetical protein AUG51_12760 [Acidobacteria bacterium 13_1_20CM_3_53_8]|nr:MAG: hypothetical protein AUG51_12760 [Acidobacteria bacterium 13_1_20CM_3_53_8]